MTCDIKKCPRIQRFLAELGWVDEIYWMRIVGRRIVFILFSYSSAHGDGFRSFSWWVAPACNFETSWNTKPLVRTWHRGLDCHLPVLWTSGQMPRWEVSVGLGQMLSKHAKLQQKKLGDLLDGFEMFRMLTNVDKCWQLGIGRAAPPSQLFRTCSSRFGIPSRPFVDFNSFGSAAQVRHCSTL